MMKVLSRGSSRLLEQKHAWAVDTEIQWTSSHCYQCVGLLCHLTWPAG